MKSTSTLLTILTFILGTQLVFAQKPFMARVLSFKDSLPIASANISLKGRPTQTQSNAEGRFSFVLESGRYEIKVKHIGYKEQVVRFNIPIDKELIIFLIEEDNQLEDINVSTGYQKIPKERAAGAFTQLDNSSLNEQSGTNILARLEGITSGVNFDTKASTNSQRKLNFNVRGLSSINGPLDPLIVLDNFPYDGDINNINPNDVESITILKDAAASSIWGARAGNGVVVITTKKGKLNQKTSVEFRSSLIISEKSDNFKLPEISSSDFIDVEQLMFAKGAFNSVINNQPYAALTPAIEVLLKRRNLSISAADSARQINALKQTDIRDDYSRYFLRKPYTQQHFINFSGGTQKNAFGLSAAYDQGRSELDAPFDKVNIKFTNSYVPYKNLKIDLGIYYTNSSNESGRPKLNTLKIGGKKVPYLDLADEDGNPLEIALNYNKRYTSTTGNGKLLDWSYVPLEDYKHAVTRFRLNDFLSNIGIRQTILSWLSMEARYQYERQQSGSNNIQELGSYAARNMINTFTQISPTTGMISYIVPKGGILYQSSSVLTAHNLRAQVNVDKSLFSGVLTGIIGAEIRNSESEGQSGTYYGYQENPLLLANVDLTHAYPNFITGGNQNIPGGQSFTRMENNFVSAFTNLAYTYQNRYTLSASARRDASNLFGVNANDKWKPLWSIGGAWDIAKEPFYHQDWLTTLKLRITYGYQGNVDLTRTAVAILRYSDNSPANLPQASINQLNNPELKWEKTGQLNIGVDFATSSTRISGSIDIYSKHGSDLYGPVPYDYTAWGQSDYITRNVADMKGRGVEIDLHSRNIEGKFSWQSHFMFNYNKAVTSNYFGPAGYTASVVGSGSAITPAVGYPLYSIASYKWAGLDGAGNPQGILNGKPSIDYRAIALDRTRNGIASGSIIYHGSSLPDKTGSLINTFSYEGLSLSLNIGYKFGYYFRRPALSYTQLFGQGTGHSEFTDRWQKPGDELLTDVPSLVYPANSNRDSFYLLSEATVERGDHIRLQYINLSYSFSPVFLGNIGIKKLNIYSYASNMGILWRENKKGLDPEYPGILSLPKTYTFGLNLNF
ncbi:SusC/RagA family TonB-linked outer membrane protein [Pedobacter alluvionis]|nr:SusC/RagA family TonB-linked outer membrane protein [Pedobacter alluvionis]RLJ73657.1 TonB-linked SusC/RagA family outer membrane protein [Pedobacter alluvionis]